MKEIVVESLNSVEKLNQQILEERARISTDRMDVSFGELVNMYKNGELTIRPEYQRLFRWSADQKTALIESILLGIPVPPIFVAEDQNGIWELVDGLQRVSTVISFFGELKDDLTTVDIPDASDDLDENEREETISINKWTLESGSLLKDLGGFNIDTLPKKYAINIKRASCRVEILRGESNTSMKYELFKRLNSGGSKLTPQEIRNAIYRGIDPKVNILIEELSRNQEFINLTDLNEQKKQELYDQELVLRFIAFLNKIDEINSNTESYLDSFMDNAVQDADFDIEYYRAMFLRVMAMLSNVAEKSIFRSNRNLFVPAYFEGITIGIAQNIALYERNQQLILINIERLKQDEAFKRYSGSASNSKNRVKNRLNRANEIFAMEN